MEKSAVKPPEWIWHPEMDPIPPWIKVEFTPQQWIRVNELAIDLEKQRLDLKKQFIIEVKKVMQIK
jgi:hypothetical protein